MSAPKSKNQINLLPKEEFESSTFGRILLWLMGSFRIIVIITELVVMIAFLSRFWLDSKNSDLNDTIKQKQAVIEGFANFEKKFRTTQKKLEVFSQIADSGGVASSSLNKIVSYLPENVALLSFSYSPNSVGLEGTTTDESGVTQFIVNLEESKSFGVITLESFNSDPKNDSLLNFSLSLEISKKGV
jgi:Tfp pilus assembly protein PilN